MGSFDPLVPWPALHQFESKWLAALQAAAWPQILTAITTVGTSKVVHACSLVSHACIRLGGPRKPGRSREDEHLPIRRPSFLAPRHVSEYETQVLCIFGGDHLMRESMMFIMMIDILCHCPGLSSLLARPLATIPETLVATISN